MVLKPKDVGLYESSWPTNQSHLGPRREHLRSTWMSWLGSYRVQWMHPSVLLNSTEWLDSGNFQIELRFQAFIITHKIKGSWAKKLGQSCIYNCWKCWFSGEWGQWVSSKVSIRVGEVNQFKATLTSFKKKFYIMSFLKHSFFCFTFFRNWSPPSTNSIFSHALSLMNWH